MNIITKLKLPVMEINQGFTNLINTMKSDYTTVLNLIGNTICSCIGLLLALRGVIFFYRIFKERNTGEDMTHTLVLTAFFFAGTGIFTTIGKVFF